MKIIEVAGAAIPAIGFGTYRLEGETCSRMVAKAIEAGYRHVDTARMYGNEVEVGRGVRESGIARNEVFVTTKVWTDDLGSKDFIPAARKAIDALDLGAVDLLLIHWPNVAVPLAEAIEGLNRAVDEGLATHIGVANFTSAMMDEAVKLSSAPLVCNQVEYHPRLSQDAILEACERNDMALIAYSPIGQGKDLLNDPEIREMAERHGRTPAQIVLRWEIEQSRVGAIPRTSNPDRLRENLEIFDFELTEAERSHLFSMAKQRQRLVNPSFVPQWDAR